MSIRTYYAVFWGYLKQDPMQDRLSGSIHDRIFSFRGQYCHVHIDLVYFYFFKYGKKYFFPV